MARGPENSLSRPGSNLTSPEASTRAFSGTTAARLLERLHAVAREVDAPGDRLYVSTLLRAVRNDGVELPALPEEALRLQRLLASPNAAITEFARCVQRDPVTSARFLKLANSSLYGCGRKVIAVEEAAVRIGFEQSTMIAMALLASAKLFKIVGDKKEAASLSRHALGAATAAQVVARASGAPELDAFMAGLTHDVGKLFMLSVASQLFRESRGQKAPQPATVERLMAEFHEDFGALAAEVWGFEPKTILAIQHHHLPEQNLAEALKTIPEEALKLTLILSAGDLIGDLVLDPNLPVYPALEPVLAQLGLTFDGALGAAAQDAFEVFERETGDDRGMVAGSVAYAGR